MIDRPPPWPCGRAASNVARIRASTRRRRLPMFRARAADRPLGRGEVIGWLRAHPKNSQPYAHAGSKEGHRKPADIAVVGCSIGAAEAHLSKRVETRIPRQTSTKMLPAIRKNQSKVGGQRRKITRAFLKTAARPVPGRPV